MYELNFDENLCAACPTCDCLVKCQYLNLNKDEAHEEMLKVSKGEDSFILSDCVTCYACEEYCQFGNHPFYIICERREEKGILTASRPITNQWINMLDFQDQNEVGEIKDKAMSLCCLEEFKQLELSKGRLFEDISAASIFGTEFFCQAVYLHFAKPSVIKERLPKVINNIAQLGIKQLICMHDECYGTFVSLAPAYGMEVPFEPIYYLEYLFEKLKSLKSEIEPLRIKVAYQRSCSSRLSPDKHVYVQKIFDLIGVDLPERTYQDENALCCAGLFGNVTAPGIETVIDIQKKNLDDIVKTGAEYCVFNCPFCQTSLSETVFKNGVKPIHIIDLCKIAIGEKSLTEVE